MELMLDKKFGIKSDDMSFVLFTTEVYGKDSKNVGQSYEKVHGYYGTLHQAMKGYIKHSSRKDNKVVKTAEEVIVMMNKIHENVDKALIQIKKEHLK